MPEVPYSAPAVLSPLARTIPPVSDAMLLEMVNCLGVSADLTHFPRQGGFFKKFVARSVGLDAQSLVNRSMVDAQRILLRQIDELTGLGSVSNLALAQAGQMLAETKEDLISVVGQTDNLTGELTAELARLQSGWSDRHHSLANKVSAMHHLDSLITAWSAEETYRGLPWALQVILLAQETYRGAVGQYELRTGDLAFRDLVANKILAGPRTRLPRLALLGEELLRPCLSLESPGDLPMLADLVRSYSRLSGGEVPTLPLPFVVGRCLVLAAQSPNAPDIIPRALADAAQQVGYVGRTVNPRAFVRQVIASTAAVVAKDWEALNAAAAESTAAEPRRAASTVASRALELRTSRPAFGGAPRTGESPSPDAAGAPVWGLVLAGGGAKGAYQVGVVQRLAEEGLEPTAVSGASIGALNAAVVASAPSLAEGAARLAQVWEALGAAGRTPEVPGELTGVVLRENAEQPPIGLGELYRRTRSPILGEDFIRGLLADWVDPDGLANGPDLWVSVFPSVAGWTGLGWLVDLARSAAGAPAQWLHVQALRREQVHEALLASAALPFVFPARRVGDRLYRDGGLGDNVPLGPLSADSDATHAVVVHLGNGVVWDHSAFPGCAPLEIRPGDSIVARPGRREDLGALLDFRPSRIEELRRQGYDDTAALMGQVRGMLERAHAHRRSVDSAARAVAEAYRVGRPGQPPGGGAPRPATGGT